MIGRTSRLPGAETIDSDGPTTAFDPHHVHHDGHVYLMVHAEGLTTSLVCPGGEIDGNERIGLTIWSKGPSGSPSGIALTFTPSDAMLTAIVDSLVQMRDRQREAAVAQAEAAFGRARRS